MTWEYIKALASVLDADTDVSSNVSNYDGDNAIFTGDPPEDRPDIYIDIEAPITNEDQNRFSNKQNSPTEPVIDIDIYQRESMSHKSVNVLARDVYKALHRKVKTISDEMSGRDCMRIRCNPPVQGNSTSNFVGRIVTVSANLTEI